MPFYLYECINEECKHKQEDFKVPSKREISPPCEKCGSEMKRIFHPKSGGIVFWKYIGDTGPTTQGPTRKNHYTVGDVAEEHDWYSKWGIKK